MLKLSHPITSINGFKIGDKVRLKDGDGRPHIIKSFSIDGMKEFFFEAQFEDGTDTMLDNIAPLPSNLDEAADRHAALEQPYKWEEEHDGSFGVTPLFVMSNIRSAFKAGAEWMAGQGETIEKHIFKDNKGVGILMYLNEKLYNQGDKVVVQIRKK